MKPIRKSPVHIGALVALSISPCLCGQDEPATQKPVQAQPPDYCSMSKILGAKVRMNPGADAKREAEKEGEAAKRPEGKVDDVVVESRTGAIQYAVISFGGFAGIGDKTVAVPCAALSWNAAHERFELDASEDRLRVLPAFDLGKARKTGLDNACDSALVNWRSVSPAKDDPATAKEAGSGKGEAREASADKQQAAKTLEGTSFFVIPTRFVCATEIDDFPVYTCNDKFGKISDLLVDRGQRTLALAVVKHGGALGLGGTEYLVPFRALNFCTSGEERVLCLPCDGKRMETAIVYEKPKHGVVDSDAAKRALAKDDFSKTEKR